MGDHTRMGSGIYSVKVDLSGDPDDLEKHLKLIRSLSSEYKEDIITGIKKMPFIIKMATESGFFYGKIMIIRAYTQQLSDNVRNASNSLAETLFANLCTACADIR